MTAEDFEGRTGDAIAVRTLDAVRDYFFVLSGEVTDPHRVTINIRDVWRCDVDSDLGRDITDALDQSGREEAILTDNEVTLAGCQHDPGLIRCRCHFGTVQAVEAGPIVDPTKLRPGAERHARGER